MSTQVTNFLITAHERYSGITALYCGGKHYSYSELFNTATGIASWLLAHHLEPGFRGAILTDDPFEYITAYFGILLAGGVAVGLNTQTSPDSLAYVLNDSESGALFSSTRFIGQLTTALPLVRSLKTLIVPGLADNEFVSLSCFSEDYAAFSTVPGQSTEMLPYRSACDFAQIIYTSGTTGVPKGVTLRHANLVANTASIVSYLKLQATDRVMAVLPFFYSYGNSVLLTHIAVGGSLVVNQNFLYPNSILQQMTEFEVTGFSGVPSTFALLLNRSAISSFDFPTLRYVTQAGAALSPELAQRLKQVFPKADIFIMYGQTEASARLAYLDPQYLERKPGTIGKSIPGVELTLRDKTGRQVKAGETGEIVARGDNIMAGYWNRPEETKAVLRSEGLWTGDLARTDEDGFLYIISRKSDLIKSGAHRIGPKEIEDVLAAHPAVQEVAVVGMPDEILGERIRACIVLNYKMECNDKDLKYFCKKKLPQYKIPHEIIYLKSIPKTTSGKIKKNELKFNL